MVTWLHCQGTVKLWYCESVPLLSQFGFFGVNIAMKKNFPKFHACLIVFIALNKSTFANRFIFASLI